ncbi:MAG: hypothetical protein HQ483_05755 [Rhodospirillales bacterium]|nr:hypothetical protein [Rhodospirillales bacterium]
MIRKGRFYFHVLFAAAGLPLLPAGVPLAATLSATVNVTIGAGGGVGAVIPPITTPPPVTPPAVTATTGVNRNGSVTTAVGDPVSIQTSTFREVASPPARTTASPATPASTTSAATGSAAQQRFSTAARATASLFGGASSVSVSGVPNQTYNISLPGKTTYSTGSETINIGSFAHNAGATPQLGASGAGSFNVAAQVGDTGAGEAAGGEDGDNEEDLGDVGSVQQILSTPVVTRSPFVSIIVSYN